MDLSERDKISSEKIEDHVSYANAGFPVSIADSLNPSLWNPSMSSANLGLGEGDITAIDKSTPAWNPSDSFSRGGSFLSPNLSHFTSDPAFIQRTARISCLSATSLGNNMGNPFGASSHSLGPFPNAQYQKIDINTSESSKESPLPRDDEAGEVDLKEHSSPKTLAAKKRKKFSEELEVPAETKENVDSKPKLSQKQLGKDASEEPKEDYVHVRARRGQATNSHSLAERVRREKISQRMKFLQELVPGCSKVTGKAVMLDEIINYVRSLQRQVEFLSMKLATVNPRADFNLEALHSKDFLQSNSSSAIGFSTEMVHPQLHSSRHGLMQAGISGNLNPANAFRRATNAQVNSMPSACDEQLHNVMQMAAFSNNPQEPRTQ